MLETKLRPSFLLICLHSLTLFCVCVFVCAREHMEIRGHLVKALSLLPLCGFWVLNKLAKATLSDESSQQPCFGIGSLVA